MDSGTTDEDVAGTDVASSDSEAEGVTDGTEGNEGPAELETGGT